MPYRDGDLSPLLEGSAMPMPERTLILVKKHVARGHVGEIIRRVEARVPLGSPRPARVEGIARGALR